MDQDDPFGRSFLSGRAHVQNIGKGRFKAQKDFSAVPSPNPASYGGERIMSAKPGAVIQV
jgi:hypothetical protein